VSKSAATLSDQAKELRRIVDEHRQVKRGSGKLRTIAVLSGKGGVGKSNLSVNLACALAEIGKRVVLLEADVGLSNIDMLCGITVKYHLGHLIDGSRRLEEVLVELDRNVWILPGGSGIKELAELDEPQLAELIDELQVLEESVDVLLIDTGAGLHRGALAFAAAADTMILLTTPEPTSIRDAYGVLKTLQNSQGSESKNIVSVVNMARSEREGLEVANRLRVAAGQFLGLPISYLGCILKDHFVEQAVRMRKPFYQLYPHSPAAECIRKIVYAPGMFGKTVVFPHSPRGLKSFFSRLTRGYFAER
jgi:flagellar biosynthesis protein FlhG